MTLEPEQNFKNLVVSPTVLDKTVTLLKRKRRPAFKNCESNYPDTHDKKLCLVRIGQYLIIHTNFVFTIINGSIIFKISED
ncbi:hypothetical protein NBRC116188_27060 [Oceaniserpentilla sp. 4NH20-0058]|uniref:hypothetical protein n=1 Tax=Oceaniserpentilla sp. 4NH20-0058 TaxID=3127660 RepID=UPI0031055025